MSPRSRGNALRRLERPWRFDLRLWHMLNRLPVTKRATVRQVQRELAGVLAEVRKGHKIAVTKHGKVVAHIVPAIQTACRRRGHAGDRRSRVSHSRQNG